MHAVGTDKLITAGAIEDKRTPGRVVVFDLKQNKPIRVEKGFKPTTDAIQVGDDIYVANGNVITRVTPQGKRDDVFSSKFPTAFAQSDAGAWISDNAEGKIYQVAEGDKWMKQPRAVVSDLQGPQGVAVANDCNLLVIEEKTGRLLKVDLKSGQRAIIADAMQFSFKSQLLLPIAQVAQTSDGAIYVVEPGAGRMSVLEPRN